MIWSDGLERLHGYDSGTFDDRFDRYENIIHDEDREHVRASIRSAIESGRSYDIEYRSSDLTARCDGDRALAAGYDGYCPKPLDGAEFASVIASLLATRQTLRSAS